MIRESELIKICMPSSVRVKNIVEKLPLNILISSILSKLLGIFQFHQNSLTGKYLEKGADDDQHVRYHMCKQKISEDPIAAIHSSQNSLVTFNYHSHCDVSYLDGCLLYLDDNRQRFIDIHETLMCNVVYVSWQSISL